MWMTSTLHGFTGVTVVVCYLSGDVTVKSLTDKESQRAIFITQIASMNSTKKMVINNAEGNETAGSQPVLSF